MEIRARIPDWPKLSWKERTQSKDSHFQISKLTTQTAIIIKIGIRIGI